MWSLCIWFNTHSCAVFTSTLHNKFSRHYVFWLRKQEFSIIYGLQSLKKNLFAIGQETGIINLPHELIKNSIKRVFLSRKSTTPRKLVKQLGYWAACVEVCIKLSLKRQFSPFLAVCVCVSGCVHVHSVNLKSSDPMGGKCLFRKPTYCMSLIKHEWTNYHYQHSIVPSVGYQLALHHIHHILHQLEFKKQTISF